jgi:BirA family biotin operon repressor/biotin-[acetyl-CoA-carboxylase] ligase
VSLAVRKALESFGLFSAQCKWPNDIYVEGKKLAGILVEAYGESHGLTELVIGIGLNVNMIEGGEEASGIEKPWISMQELLFLPQNRSAVARELIGVVSLYLSRFLEQGFDDFIEEWSVSDALVNEFITLKIGSQEIIGIARGINPLGHLKIEASDGKIMSFSSGEASVSGQITGFLT